MEATESETGPTKQLTSVALPPGPSRNSRVLGVTAVLATVIVLATLGYWLSQKRLSGTQPVPEPCRLAILPFRNLKPDASTDFLGYSLADAIITKLGYVQALRVRPSYAIEKYRDQVVEISKVATDLDVDILLTGNFIRDGDDLRITFQLFDVKTRSGAYAGKARLIFDIKGY